MQTLQMKCFAFLGELCECRSDLDQDLLEVQSQQILKVQAPLQENMRLFALWGLKSLLELTCLFLFHYCLVVIDCLALSSPSLFLFF